MDITITPIRKILGITTAAAALVFGAPAINAQNKVTLSKDSITMTKDTLVLAKDTFQYAVPPTGTTEDSILNKAPSPQITIKGEKKNAAIVVDLNRNILYQYDVNGKPTCAYLVASGKKSSPTDTGIRVVTHVESYPYKTASPKTKRRKKPWDYGPRVICLETVDPQTGARGKTGEFIHGNNNPKSLGKYASLGCIRMDNGIIKKLAKEVKRGDLVLITKYFR